MKIKLAEAVAVAVPDLAPAADGTIRYRARLIEGDRWGSSGYYGADVIKRDGPTCWPAGTQMYADHPAESEKWDRPERSIRDLVGRIDSTPVYEGDGLYADVLFFSHVAPMIRAIGADVGLSIRAGAEVTQGEAAGRTGAIITRLAEGQSVDVVTKAGAGGALVQLLESARHADHVDADAVAGQLAEALPGGMTGDDLRKALRKLVADAFPSTYASLEDFTDELVWFRVYADGSAGTWQQAYTSGDGSADSDAALTLTGDPIEVRQVTTYVPVEPSGSLPPTQRTATVTAAAESQGGAPVALTQIDESELATLREAQAREAAATARAEAAERRIAEADARSAARPIATALLAESTILPAVSQASVVESVLLAVPLSSDGRLDETTLRARATEARTQRETELAAALEAAGVGTVRNGATPGGGAPTGAPTGAAGGAAVPAQLTEARRAAFGSTRR